MTIEGLNGRNYNVTGNSQGNLNTVLGAIGTAGTLMGGTGLFGNWGNNRQRCGSGEDEYVTRYEAKMMDSLAAKDAEIANLRADAATDKKLVDVYAQLNKVDNQQRDRIDALGKELLDKITFERESRLVAEKDQAVFNQSTIGSISTINTQIAGMNNILSSISTSVVPQSKVCQTGCGCMCN